STITLQGRNSTIQRESNAPEFRILAVASSGDLTLHSTTVSGGSAYDLPDDGGGVYNSGILTLTNSTVSGNGSLGDGSGIANTGTLTVSNSTVTDNYAVYGVGGGVFNSGTLTLTNSTVSGNSLYTGSYSYAPGCGVFNSGTAILTNSTVSGNRSDGRGSCSGGGISNYGTLTLTNSTVSANSGGGIYNGERYYDPDRPIAILTLSNSTVSGNTAGGVTNRKGTLLTLARTLISGNKSYSAGSNVESSGTIVANNHNLFGHDGDAGVVGFSPGPTDIVPNEDLGAILKPLADNGGPTKTRALPAGSPAIDQSPANSGCKPTDQRGVTRPQGAACDIGAFEKGPPVRCGGQIARILGTAGNDNSVSGTPGPDVIHGLAGRDTIDGLGGNDIICGGTGNDKLFGASGADALNGGSGTDTCNGGSGADTGVSCETEISIP
ncbi:MAG: choice-of-anchor Q domain-containing protein, partial [Gammaproteobacteria bacterium]